MILSKYSFIFSYKIVIGVSDPVGNELELRDLKPYTNYQLEVRSRFGNKENWGSVEFSTGSKISKFLCYFDGA